MARKLKVEPRALELGGENFSVVFIGDLYPDYRRNPKTEFFCILCHRDIDKPETETAHLHVIDGGTAVLALADEDRHHALSLKQPGGQFPGEMGAQPVGSECARKLPKGFVHTNATTHPKFMDAQEALIAATAKSQSSTREKAG